MNALTFKKLETIEEFKVFSQGYKLSFENKKLSPKHAVAPEVLQSYTKVYGAFLNDSMVAGYVINDLPVRSFGLLSNEIKEKLFEKYNQKGKDCEVASVWCSNSLEKSKMNSLWNHLSQEIVSMQPKRVFSSCYKGHGMFKVYNLVHPEIVHHAQDEMDNHVFYYSRLKLYTFIYLASIPKRINYFLSSFKTSKVAHG